jgi:CBS domain-containing protein
MAPEAPSRPKPGAVLVRSRRLVGNGHVRLELTVPCRERGVDVPLEVCGRCDLCDGLLVDGTTEAVEVACVRASEPPFDDDLGERHRTASTTPVSAIMNTHVVCLERDLAVATLGPVMMSLNFSGAAVVDDEGRPIGVLSQSDVFRCLCTADGERDPDMLDRRVDALMTTPALCLSEGDSIAKAAALMAFEGIHRVPVVGVTGKLTGMISPLDVLRWLARENGYIIGPEAPVPRQR